MILNVLLKQCINNMATRYKFFLGGIFSNWYCSEFTVDGVKYNCGEQYIMYQKAMLFNDLETASIILKENDPSCQKALGRSIKNFDTKVWDLSKYNIVKKGLREKFVQNPELKHYLLCHKGYQIVEANPENRIWGIGYSSSEALNNIYDWGENLLGKILTELTEELYYNDN